MEYATGLLMLANDAIIRSPFIAGVIVALALRKTYPRVCWLVFAACLIPLVSFFGNRVFHIAYSPSDHDFDVGVVDLVYDAVGICGSILDLASMVLFILAVTIMLRARRAP